MEGKKKVKGSAQDEWWAEGRARRRAEGGESQ